MAKLVAKLVPEARVGVAHGQMNERGLEKVMLAFVRREIDVLVCTTIIESGLDIPSANTIIINNADRLGLSQIYQLRGRVGRAGEKAYAYLFIKSETSLTGDAKKRLKALMDFTHLGAGFSIAMHDLQIRGAGNMLGEVQSGHAAEVGYELYVRMLEESVARLKGEAPPEGPEPELNLSVAAGLPEAYVPDPQVRLSLYKRLSLAKSAAEVSAVEAELDDRFGPPPEPARHLLLAVELKALLRRMMGTRLDVSAEALTVHFGHEPRVDLDRLMGLARDKPEEVKVYPDGRVAVRLDGGGQPLARAREFLSYISGEAG
jgi:transcription-repair coupling factor (superfamily II helicase)